jgi:hypothetical protein
LLEKANKHKQMEQELFEKIAMGTLENRGQSPAALKQRGADPLVIIPYIR